MKKDPYRVFRMGKNKSKLEQRKRRKALRERWWRRRTEHEYAIRQKEFKHLSVDLCPNCESRITKIVDVDEGNYGVSGETKYLCKKCGFLRAEWWDDEDED